MAGRQLRWKKGGPPAIAGWYLLQMQSRDIVAGEMLWTDDDSGGSYLDLLVGDDYVAFRGTGDNIIRHFGPIRNPPTGTPKKV